MKKNRKLVLWNYKRKVNCELLIPYYKYIEFWYKYLKYLMENLYYSIHTLFNQAKITVVSFYFREYNGHIKYMIKNSEIHTWNCAKKNTVSFSIYTISFCINLFSCNIGYRLYKRTFNLVKQFFKKPDIPFVLYFLLTKLKQNINSKKISNWEKNLKWEKSNNNFSF